MYEADIERLVAQAQRIQRLGEEVLNEAETLDENDVDTSAATGLGSTQTDFQDEMEQALLDFETALERSDGFGRNPDYAPGSGSFTISWDSSAEEATITYEGSPDISNTRITVTVAGTEQSSMFSDPTSTGESEVVDTSSLVDGDTVDIEWVAQDTGSTKFTLPNTNRSPVSKTNLPAESTLTSTEQTYSNSLTINR